MNVQDIIKLIQTNNLMKFYNSKQWRSLRLEAMRRDNYECQMHKAKGKYKKAENVHHMKEVKTHPQLALTLNNLQCLCIRCHNDIHDRLDHVEKAKLKFENEERW